MKTRPLGINAAPLSQLLRAANSQLSAQSLSIEVRNWANYLATLIPIEAVEADTALLVFLVPKATASRPDEFQKTESKFATTVLDRTVLPSFDI